MWEHAVDIAKMIAASVPLAALVLALHTTRTSVVAARFDAIDKRFDATDGKIKKLDTDFDGVTKQLAGTVVDIERRFVPISQFTDAINALSATLGRLDQNILQIALNRGERH